MPKRRSVRSGMSTKTGIVRDRRIVTMRYYMKKTMLANTILDNLQLRANGLTDPEVALGGHQPRGFDQYMALYKRYVVMGSKITVLAWKRANSEAALVGVRVDDALNSPDTDDFAMVENKRSTFGVIRTNQLVGVKLKVGYNTKALFNRKSPVDDTDLIGTTSADPTTQALYTVSAISATDTDAVDIDVIIWIDYRVMLLEPLKFGAS